MVLVSFAPAGFSLQGCLDEDKFHMFMQKLIVGNSKNLYRCKVRRVVSLIIVHALVQNHASTCCASRHILIDCIGHYLFEE
jgi:hypothetical protein